jgi:5-dehydro-2-deoxygluconokinase
MMIDLLCIGRAGVDLYGEQIGKPLEEVTSFAKYVGGCPANISVGTRRLGVKSGMLTRVGDDGLGRFVRAFLESEGVDVSGVRYDAEHNTGLVFLGIEPPDRFPILFYRTECADIHLSVDDIDEDRIASTRAILISGTGLSREPSRAATRKAVEIARRLGKKVILDVDVRPILWASAEENRRELQAILPLVDLAVGTEEEVAAASPDGLDGIRKLTKALLVMKLGPRGARALPLEGPPVEVPGFKITILNTLGAGDGFMSGFLRGWLDDEPLATCLRLGNAVGAIVVTRHGCAPAMPTMDEVRALMSEQPL